MVGPIIGPHFSHYPTHVCSKKKQKLQRKENGEEVNKLLLYVTLN